MIYKLFIILFISNLSSNHATARNKEASAMEKFTKWSTEHEASVNRRQGAHRKARIEKRNVPVVKKVAEKVEEAPAAEAAPEVSEEPKTEE